MRAKLFPRCHSYVENLPTQEKNTSTVGTELTATALCLELTATVGTELTANALCLELTATEGQADCYCMNAVSRDWHDGIFISTSNQVSKRYLEPKTVAE